MAKLIYVFPIPKIEPGPPEYDSISTSLKILVFILLSVNLINLLVSLGRILSFITSECRTQAMGNRIGYYAWRLEGKLEGRI